MILRICIYEGGSMTMRKWTSCLGLAAMILALPACGIFGGGAAPPVTFTFAAPATCPEPSISVEATGNGSGFGTTRGTLEIKVCIECATVAVMGADVTVDMSAVKEVVPPAVGAGIEQFVQESTDATGCFVYEVRLANVADSSLLSGLTVPYTIVDSAGTQVDTGTITISTTG